MHLETNLWESERKCVIFKQINKINLRASADNYSMPVNTVTLTRELLPAVWRCWWHPRLICTSWFCRLTLLTSVTATRWPSYTNHQTADKHRNVTSKSQLRSIGKVKVIRLSNELVWNAVLLYIIHTVCNQSASLFDSDFPPKNCCPPTSCISANGERLLPFTTLSEVIRRQTSLTWPIYYLRNNRLRLRSNMLPD